MPQSQEEKLASVRSAARRTPALCPMCRKMWVCDIFFTGRGTLRKHCDNCTRALDYRPEYDYHDPRAAIAVVRT